MSAPALAFDTEPASLQGVYVPIERLLKDADMTAYDLANEFVKRDLSAMAAYRLHRANGRLTRFDARVLDALADIFEIGPRELHKLIVYEPRKRSD